MTAEMDLADHVLDLVGGRAEAEVVVTGGTSALTRFANSFIHQNVGEEGSTVSLRVSLDGRVSTATTTRTDDEPALAAFVEAALDSAALQPVDADWPGCAPPAHVPVIDHHDAAVEAASPADRADYVKAFVDAGPGMRAAGYCETVATQSAFANTSGQRVSGRATRVTLDGIHQTESSAGSGHQTSAQLADIDAGAVGELASQRARDGSDPYDTKPGEYEVVLSPECVATISIFLAAYGFNAKAVQEGQSFVELGAAQFDPRITIVDDITDSRALGTAFDREGTPKRRVELVTAGVTSGIAHDRRTARKAGTESTGHAIAGGESFGALPTNMFFGGGTTGVPEMIASVERGLYIATFNYCRILDPKTQVVTGLTRNGTFMIENGVITGAVTNMRFTQSFLTALGPGNVLALGSDGRFADSEFGPGLVHAPSLRLGTWNFTGGADG